MRLLLLPLIAFVVACQPTRSPRAIAQCSGDDACAVKYTTCFAAVDASEQDDLDEANRACVTLAGEEAHASLREELLRHGCQNAGVQACAALLSVADASATADDASDGDKSALHHALELYEVVCTSGSARGCDKAAATAIKLGDPRSAATIYRRSCTSGHHDTCLALAELQLGDGDLSDVPEGMTLLRATCKKGHNPSCVALGTALTDQHGDRFEAARAFEQACSDKFDSGCTRLAALEQADARVAQYMRDRREREREQARERHRRQIEAAALAKAEAERRRADAAARQAAANESAARAEQQRLAADQQRVERERRYAIINTVVGALPPPSPRASQPRAQPQRAQRLCYNHTVNGHSTGEKCFSSRGDYCSSLCNESNQLSQQACQRECR